MSGSDNSQKKKNNYKLLVDPELRKGHKKLYRLNGKDVPGVRRSLIRTWLPCVACCVCAARVVSQALTFATVSLRCPLLGGRRTRGLKRRCWVWQGAAWSWPSLGSRCVFLPPPLYLPLYFCVSIYVLDNIM